MQALAYYIDLKENCRNISQARQMVSVGSAPITIFIIIKTSLLFELKNFFTVNQSIQRRWANLLSGLAVLSNV